jgi:putative transposase
MITILSTLVSLLSLRVRSRASLELDLIALRHQVIVLRRQRPRRLRLFLTDRLFWVWLYRVRPQLLDTFLDTRETGDRDRMASQGLPHPLAMAITPF